MWRSVSNLAKKFYLGPALGDSGLCHKLRTTTSEHWVKSQLLQLQSMAS